MTLQALRAQLDAKEISAVELTEQYIQRIEQTNPQLNSFITIASDGARAQAVLAQKSIDAGTSRALTGIPYAAKDLFCTRGVRTTAGSRILEHYTPPYSATAIERCGDAVLLGKTNMDEFALGSSTEYSAYGVTKNPFDLARVSGGTSGGSAAAVATGQAAFAFGTDTGGSIRQPASFCHVVGFKPTYGRISRYGVIAAASSLDTVGFCTQTVADSAYLLSVLAGHDAQDSTTPPVRVEDYSAAIERATLSNMRIGIPKEYMDVEGLDPRLKKQYEQLLHQCEAAGASLHEISLPHTQYALSAYYILNPSEVSSNLARYDGIRFGRPSPHARTLEEVFTKTRDEQFGSEAKRRILIGTFCLSSGYYDAYYKKAQKVRTLIRQDFANAFEQVDILLSPTSPVPPFRIGERITDPVTMYLADVYTIPASLAGVPAVSIPAAVVDGLPVGLQCIGPQFQESTVLRAAYAIEQQLQLTPPPLAAALAHML